jgi:hypothetical protein
MNQLTVVCGIFLSNVFGLPQIFGTDELWPILCGIIIIPIAAHIVLAFMVESPKFVYINKGDENEARRSKLIESIFNSKIQH